MAEITVPSQELIVDKQWSLDIPAQANTSSWTGRTKITGLPGAERWSVTARVRFRGSLALQKPWRAFFMKLRGMQNTFLVQAACGQRTGAHPTIAAGANAGYTLPLTGMTASTTVLKAGDFLSVLLPSGHPRLICLTQDLVANGSGNATAVFEPALGEIPATGIPVQSIEPYGMFRMANPRFSWSGGDFAFEAVEAI